MDSTYKTNKYYLPLLELVDVTSTELTCYISFAYMMHEKEDKYHWALKRCRDLLKYPYISLEVIEECC